MLRVYFWLCGQELFLMVFRGNSYEMLGINPRSAECKTNMLPTVLSHPPQKRIFYISFLLSFTSDLIFFPFPLPML